MTTVLIEPVVSADRICPHCGENLDSIKPPKDTAFVYICIGCANILVWAVDKNDWRLATDEELQFIFDKAPELKNIQKQMIDIILGSKVIQ